MSDGHESSQPISDNAVLAELVRSLLAAQGTKPKEIAIRDAQGKLLAHLIPADVPFMVQIDLTDEHREGDDELIAVESLSDVLS